MQGGADAAAPVNGKSVQASLQESVKVLHQLTVLSVALMANTLVKSVILGVQSTPSAFAARSLPCLDKHA